MKLAGLFAAAACLALSGGCLSEKTSGFSVEKGRLIIENASVALNLDIVQDALEQTPEGFAHAQVAIQNTNQCDYRCQYRFQWLNRDGLLMTQTPAPWTPKVLHGREKAVFETVCPLAGASDFRLVVRNLKEVE